MNHGTELRIGETYRLQHPPGGPGLPHYIYPGMQVRLLGMGEVSHFVESPYGQLLAVPLGSLIELDAPVGE